jgi:hypothetical protein
VSIQQNIAEHSLRRTGGGTVRLRSELALSLSKGQAPSLRQPWGIFNSGNLHEFFDSNVWLNVRSRATMSRDLLSPQPASSAARLQAALHHVHHGESARAARLGAANGFPIAASMTTRRNTTYA